VEIIVKIRRETSENHAVRDAGWRVAAWQETVAQSACLPYVAPLVHVMSKRISDTLKPYLVTLHLKETTHAAALKEMVELVRGQADVIDTDGFYKELMAREKQESTCLGNDIAFPHARTDHVKHLVILAGRSTEGVHFESANQRARLIFIIGTPKRMVTDYLATVGALARLLKEDALRQKLLAAKTSDEFLAELAEAESKL
jgi:mannitol/fructose-specific phosphotransferase system IIA component (Ntr-type)